MEYLGLDSIDGIPGACQVSQTGKSVYQVETSFKSEPGTLIRAERSAGERAVSGICGESGESLKTLPDFPQTNSKPFARSEGFFIGQPGPQRGEQDPGGGSWSGPAGGLLGVILESVAKRSEGDFADLEKCCPAGVITGSCANGHRFAKEVYCGREWCEVCNGKWEQGKAMKPTHARRFARWYPKAQQFDGIGYWTFTLPMELRARYRTKKALSELGSQVVDLLKSYGYSRGLRRWHFFGDRSKVWNPHLNCLVDGGHLNREALRSLRREYSRLVGAKLAIAEYHYFDSPGEKVHALTYVTRATFLDARWDIPMALELKGFRNQLWWGSKLWDGEPVWSLDDLPGEREAELSDSQAKAVASLESGECPYDGLPISWERFLPISILPELGGCRLAAGYWELPYVRPPPYRLDLSKLELLRGKYGELAKTIGGSYLPRQVAESRWTEFEAQHKRRASWLRELEAIKSQAGTSEPEVLESAEKSFEYRGSQGGFAGGE
ncbi:hypothetical protein ES703_76496 [subsurface metagenome]